MACVRIVGNRPYNVRRSTTSCLLEDDKIRNDVNLLSYYLKNRKAAEKRDEPKVVLDSGRLNRFSLVHHFTPSAKWKDQRTDKLLNLSINHFHLFQLALNAKYCRFSSLKLFRSYFLL